MRKIRTDYHASVVGVCRGDIGAKVDSHNQGKAQYFKCCGGYNLRMSGPVANGIGSDL